MGTIADGNISYSDSPYVTFNENEYLFRYAKPKSKIKEIKKRDPTKWEPKNQYDSVGHDIRIVINTEKTSNLMHLLKQLDNLHFTNLKEITISCTGGKLTNTEYNALKKISEEIGGHVTPYI